MLTTIFEFLKQYEYVTIGVVIALLVIFIVMFVMNIVSLVKLRKLRKKYQAFMRDDDGMSLESVIEKHLGEIDGLLADTEVNANGIKKLDAQIKFAFQKIGMVKYDAFDEMGGKLSFTLSLLNERDDGFVMNAVHSREGCYTYLKEVVAGKPIIPLSAEEQEALDRAMKGA